MYRARLPLLLAAAVAASLLAGVRPAPASHGPTLAWERIISSETRQTSVSVADVNGDGRNDVVVGNLDGTVRVYGAGGRMLRGWPARAVPYGSSSPSAVDSTPTVADINNDGKAEVIVGVGSVWVKNQHGGLVVFNRRGQVKWRYATDDIYTAWGMGPDPDGYREGVFSTPAVGNIDRTPGKEIVFGTWDHKIVALDKKGRMVPGFPYRHDDTISGSPALFDVDGDGRHEIFIGGDSMVGGDEDWSGGVLRALDVVGKRVVQRWKARVPEIFWSSPAIGDIDNDGRMEIVLGTGLFYNRTASRKVYAFNLENGTRVPGWPRSASGYTLASPALGDVSGDGRLDVVMVTRDGRAHAWKGNGKPLWSVDPEEGRSGLQASPLIADVTGDGRNEVVVGGGHGLLVLGGRSGKLLHALDIDEHWTSLGSPAVAKFGRHGWRVVSYGFRNGRARVAAYDIPTPGVKPPWRQFRRTEHHTGAFGGRDRARW